MSSTILSAEPRTSTGEFASLAKENLLDYERLSVCSSVDRGGLDMTLRDRKRRCYEHAPTDHESAAASTEEDEPAYNEKQQGLQDRSAIVGPVVAGQDYPQLTIKAVVVGITIGIFNAVLALYYSLRTGVNPALNVLGGLGGFMLMKTLLRYKLIKQSFSVQENAVIQTCAVATYSMGAGAGFASGLLALTPKVYEKVGNLPGNNIEDVYEITWLRGFGWCAAVSLFGFFVAFPLRKYMILEQRLLFPSGTATASMIKTLHTSRKAAEEPWKLIQKSCGLSYLWLLFLYFFDGIRQFPIFGIQALKFKWILEFGPGVAAIGLMLPTRVICSMFAGAVLSFGILGPLLTYFVQGDMEKDSSKWFETNEYDGLQAYTTIPAIAIIVVDAFYCLIKVLRSIVRSMKENKVKKNEAEIKCRESQVSESEVIDSIFLNANFPAWMWIGGLLGFAAFSVVLLSILYPIKWYQAIVPVALTPLFSIGVVQAMGLTDINVASAIGKLSIFAFGAWSNGSVVMPVILCQALIVGCAQAADLMQDFKTRYLVGASPRSMFLAQFIGAIASSAVVPTVYVMMDSAFDIPGVVMQAPYGEVYRSLAILSVQGLDALPVYCGYFLLTTSVLALAILIISDYHSDKPWAQYLPVPMAVAVGMIGPPFVALEAMIVAIGGYMWQRRDPRAFTDLRYVLASGMMAGEGIFILTEIFFTLIGIHPPVAVSFSAQ